MNPERLAELQRQRELVREQLAWLDREIAAAAQTSPPAPVPAAASADESTSPGNSPAASTISYEPDPVTAAAQMKRGCLLAAGAVLFFGLLVLLAIYFVRYRDHPLLFPEQNQPAEKTAAPPAKSPPLRK